MNRKASTELGQALTSVPALIIVFLLVLFFVIVSGVNAKNHEMSENIAEDFLNSYILFDGKILQVSKLIEDEGVCAIGKVPQKLSAALREHFVSIYGYGDAFAIIKDFGIPGIDHALYSWYGFIEDKYSEAEISISSEELNKIFGDKPNVKLKQICSSTSLYIYTRNGGVL